MVVIWPLPAGREFERKVRHKRGKSEEGLQGAGRHTMIGSAREKLSPTEQSQRQSVQLSLCPGKECAGSL